MDLEQIVSAAPSGCYLYVCGPKGLIDAARRVAIGSGWPEERVRSELFTAAPALAADRPFKAIARESGVEVEVGAGETLLDALLRAGVDVIFDCKRGECGVCTVGVIEGELDHRDYYLNGKERAGQKVVCTCVSRAKGPGLVLDV